VLEKATDAYTLSMKLIAESFGLWSFQRLEQTSKQTMYVDEVSTRLKKSYEKV